jgi:predicted ATPase/tRNA A-37 threonylcarbamoyl transferase component Bud32
MTVLAGRYTLEQLLGEGGMGVVYRGLDLTTEAQVAIKKLRANADLSHPEALERFNREAQTLRELNHPNIVKAYEAFEQDGEHYIVMEYVQGHDLAALLLQHGRLPLGRVLQIGLELSDALTRAHYLRVIHRDLKPANILLDKDGTPKLSDFGIAYLETRERVTDAGFRLGTPAYMAPEALNGQPFDTRADLWALGVLLYEMLIGRHPFAADSLSEMLINIFTLPIPDIESSRPDCPIALADLIYRLLERDTAARISSARVVGLELENILRGAERITDHPTEKTTASRFKLLDTGRRTIRLALPNNLPAQTTSFVGRDKELQDLTEMLNMPDTRLVTVLGAGGMGKTRLALAVGAALVESNTLRDTPFNDGVFFIELAALTTPEPLIATIANAFNLPFSPNSTPLEQLIDYLREKHLLLVLDNCEHILSGIGIITDLLRAAPHLKILTTSRERLNLSGEHLYPLDGLDLPAHPTREAVTDSSAGKLFLQSARRARLDFKAEDEADYALIQRICHAVGGLPLGIVLAAAWVQALSLAEVLAEVSASFDVLETELGDVPERHRSIRAMFEYSWRMMNADERALVARLSVFRGGLSRRAGQEVAGATLRALANLVNKSMLRRNPDTGSYHMHELLRQYAAAKLTESGQADATHAAHSTYYLQTLADLTPVLVGPEQVGALDQIADDFENVRAAWLWAAEHRQYAALSAVIPALNLYFERRGQYVEGEMMLGHAAGILRQQPETPQRSDTLGELLALQGLMAVKMHDEKTATALLTESESLLSDPANTTPKARAMLEFSQGQLNQNLKKPIDGRKHFERASLIYRQQNNKTLLSVTLYEWSLCYWYRTDIHQTDLEQARKLLLEAYAIQTELGDVFGRAASLLHLGTVASYMQDANEDKRFTTEALELFRQLNDKRNMVQALNNLGVGELMSGNYQTARDYLEQSLSIRRNLGNIFSLTFGLYVLSRALYCEGQFDKALTHAQDCINILLKKVDAYLDITSSIHIVRGEIHWALGNYQLALDDYSFAENLAHQQDNIDDIFYISVLKIITLISSNSRSDDISPLIQKLRDNAQTLNNQLIQNVGQQLNTLLKLQKSEVEDAEKLLDPVLQYFDSEEARQIAYSVDPWQIASYQISALLLHAEIKWSKQQLSDARAALAKALHTAQSIRSAAHLLSIAAATAIYIDDWPAQVIGWLSCVVNHPSAYAVDKVRASMALQKAANQHLLPDAQFAEICFAGQQMSIEQLTSELSAQLLPKS